MIDQSTINQLIFGSFVLAYVAGVLSILNFACRALVRIVRRALQWVA